MLVLKCRRHSAGSNALLDGRLQKLHLLRRYTLAPGEGALCTGSRRYPKAGSAASPQATHRRRGRGVPHVWYTCTMIDLRSKARQRLLAYYFANPTARLHLRDLAGQLDIDPSNLSKELHRLETAGPFFFGGKGRQKNFT